MTHRHTYIFVAAAVASVLCAAPARALIIASSATDICAPAANPCVITDTVQIVSGSILDFGLRSVQVSAGGELDLAGGFATLRCGAFSVTTGTTIGIRLRSNTGVGGSATIEARGACSGNALLPCLTDVDCSAAAAGTCTLGSGTISIGGKVLGDAQTPATLTLLAAGDVTTTEHINMNGTVNLAGGGELTINSSRGNVTIDGNINAQGGGFDSGARSPRRSPWCPWRIRSR